MSKRKFRGGKSSHEKENYKQFLYRSTGLDPTEKPDRKPIETDSSAEDEEGEKKPNNPKRKSLSLKIKDNGLFIGIVATIVGALAWGYINLAVGLGNVQYQVGDLLTKYENLNKTSTETDKKVEILRVEITKDLQSLKERLEKIK